MFADLLERERTEPRSVPRLLWMAQHHGAIGAAFVWVGINAGYLVFEVPYLHRRLLRGELWRWYLFDIGAPLLLTVATCFASRVLLSDTGSTALVVAWVAATWVLSTAAIAAFQFSRSETNLREALRAIAPRGATNSP